MNTVKIKSYAKINLTLDILGVRGGYHLLDSFVANVDLFNLVVATKRKDKLVSGRMRGLNMDSAPFENTNAYKVAEAFVEKFQTTGVDIVIYENIPVGAGLGGSSADAAGVLRALSALYAVPIEETYSIANAFGSDIRYMLQGGYARMTGRGENVEALPEKESLHFLLLCPKTAVSAGDCYREFDNLAGGQVTDFVTPRAIAAYERGDVEELGKLLKNDLFEPAKNLNADVEKAYLELKEFSPLGVMMTGSGSAVCALFESKELCEWAKSRYRGKYRAIVTKTLASGKKKIWKNPFALSDSERELFD